MSNFSLVAFHVEHDVGLESSVVVGEEFVTLYCFECDVELAEWSSSED